MKGMLDQFKRPVLSGKVFGLYNKAEKDENGILISQNNWFLNVVIQLLWNIEKIQKFMIDFASKEESKDDNELIVNIKRFIKQIESLNESEFQNPNNSIDFDVLNIRLSLNKCYGDTGQFGINQKWDAQETFEALTYQIYENLLENAPKMAKKFIKLVNIGSGGVERNTVMSHVANYISGDELIFTAPIDALKIKYKLPKYLKKYYKMKSDHKKKSDESEDDSDESDDSKTTDDSIKPPKLHLLNISWESTSSEKIYKLLTMIPNKTKFSKLTGNASGSKDFIYYFRGMVVYWGSHYFLYIRKEEQWIQVKYSIIMQTFELSG